MSKFHSTVEGLKAPIKAVGDAVISPFEALQKPFEALQKEARLGPVLHAEVLAALKKVQSKNPDLKKVLDESAGFAVVPAIGRASLVLGSAFGLGEVFKGERVIGYAAIVELTIGVQLGGTTFHELVVFHDEGALKKFKQGKYAFASDASVAFVKAGALASKGFGASSSVYAFDDGGMLLDLAIGGQKFIFKPAALGRSRTTKGALEEGTIHAWSREDDDTERVVTHHRNWKIPATLAVAAAAAVGAVMTWAHHSHRITQWETSPSAGG
jgi:lipid-binding SYLF domain-containing protein